MRPAVTAGMGVSQHLVLAAALALSMSGISLGLPQNYDDIDMSIDQPKNEKVDIRFVIIFAKKFEWITSCLLVYWWA